jgi:hypothetical protein
MIVKKQKKIRFKNECNCLCDYDELEKAILWYQNKPTAANKKIYMHAKYPTVTIHYQKVQVHRLLMMYWKKDSLDNEYVHHKDHNKLNAKRENLKVMDISTHQSIHNINKTISDEQIEIIKESNRKRKGKKYKKHREDVTYAKVFKLYKNGLSINKISKILKTDWTTIRSRLKDIHEKPELLEV